MYNSQSSYMAEKFSKTTIHIHILETNTLGANIDKKKISLLLLFNASSFMEDDKL